MIEQALYPQLSKTGMFEAAGFACRFVRPPRGFAPPVGVTTIDRLGQEVRVTTIERTIVDLFADEGIEGAGCGRAEDVDVTGRIEKTVRSGRPKKLRAEDLYWMWWLNLRSLDLLEAERSRVPFLRLVGEGKRLRLGLETVQGEGKRIWASARPLEEWNALGDRLAAAGDAVVGFDTGLAPETAMSWRLRWELDRALEAHALSEVPCFEGAKSAAILSMIAGWDGEWFEWAGLHTLGVDDDAGETKRGVELAGEEQDLYLREIPLWDAFQWLTYAAACSERGDWTPWDGDTRYFSVKWTRGIARRSG